MGHMTLTTLISK